MEIKTENTVVKRTIRSYQIKSNTNKNIKFNLNVKEFDSHCGLALVYLLDGLVHKLVFESKSFSELRKNTEDFINSLLEVVEKETGHNQLMFCFTEENFRDIEDFIEDAETEFDFNYSDLLIEVEDNIDRLKEFIEIMFSDCPNSDVMVTKSSNLRTHNNTVIVITGKGN